MSTHNSKLTLSNLHVLTNEVIERNLKEFTCDDSESNNSQILCKEKYTPDTFSVFERLEKNQSFLAKDESSGDEWLKTLIEHELQSIESTLTEDIKEFCFQQIIIFLDYKINSTPISSQIYNQEAPDVIRKVLSYVLFGNTSTSLQTHKAFNNFAREFIPNLIEKYIFNKEISLKEMLLLSIASGLIGLDLKGSIAAASKLPDIIIPLRPHLGKDKENTQFVVWEQLLNIIKQGLYVDYWHDFYSEAIENECKITWFLDDYIESFFDFYFIQEALTTNPKLNVTIVPKNGFYGNDMSFSDSMSLLDLPIFNRLKIFREENRVTITPNGPKMGTVNPKKLSSKVVDEVNASNCIVVKGCRAHELIQGSLNKTTYTAYVVAREFSESETGYNARQSPLLFFKSSPCEFSYWGFLARAKRTKQFDDGKTINICYSTLEEHEMRKKITSPKEMITALEDISAHQKEIQEDGYATQYQQEVNPIIEELVNITCNTYNLIARDYKSLRLEEPHDTDKALFDKLLKIARVFVEDGKLGDENKNISLLDVGTGSGRDLKYFRNFSDINAVGIDNSETFIAILQETAKRGEIPSGSFAKMDMRDLQYKDNSFDIVRHNATLLHMPMVGLGIGADLAVSESFRVLKPNGILFVNVKAGNKMEYMDTNEGLGGRFFQFFSEETLRELLERNGFTIIDIDTWYEDRKSGRIYWYVAYAQKSG